MKPFGWRSMLRNGLCFHSGKFSGEMCGDVL